MGPSSRLRQNLLRALLLFIPVLLVGCTPDAQPQSIFHPAGPVAREQVRLLNLTMYLALAVFVVVAVIFFVAVYRFRERAGQRAVPEQVHGNTQMEIAWTIAPILILAIIAVPTVRTAFALARAPADSLQVTVEANQWWFAMEYTDLGITTANELRIPVGKPVSLRLESRDVIHSFWVPRLAGKVDLIPNRTNHMWLQADEPGIYYGQCAEFCGASHARMRFRVKAVPQAEFDAWVAHRTAMPTTTGTAPADPLAARGRELFVQEKACFSCHAIDGTDARGNVGPNLTDVGERTTIAAGVLDNTPENLTRWLHDPQEVKPGAKMPNLKLTDDELAALVAYLRSLK